MKAQTAWINAVIAICATVQMGYAQPAPDQSLLRVERIREGEAVCALIHADGSYRLEKLFSAKAEIYRGNISTASAEELRRLLANDRLRKLSQDEIRLPLISDSIDDLQVAIWRDRGWQELSFLSPESRKPYHEVIDPLLHWFQDLQKQRPAAVRLNEPADRCMPTSTTNLVAVEANTDITKSDTKPAQGLYLFRLQTSHFYRVKVESTCTIVFSDGRYHSETSTQEYGASRQDQGSEGQLTTEAAQRLHEILDSSDLKAAPTSTDFGNGLPAQEGTVSILSIPRKDQLQRLLFSTAFNTKGNAKEIGGQTNLRYSVSDQRLLDPLRHWMKQNISSRNGDLHGAASNECSARESTTSQ